MEISNHAFLNGKTFLNMYEVKLLFILGALFEAEVKMNIAFRKSQSPRSERLNEDRSKKVVTIRENLYSND